MPHRLAPFAVCACLCAGAFPRAAVAQQGGALGGPTAQSPGQPPTIQERVTVVATRVPEPPEEVPAAVEVFMGDELRNRGATDVRGALALATGVDIAPGGDDGPASAVPEFWGLKEFDAFLLIVDDVPWGGAFNPDLSTSSLEDVERIEVLRGAAPVTYDLQNLVVAQAVNGLPSLTNAGSERFKGLETSCAWFPSAGVTARATYSFHDARFRDYLTEFDGVPTPLGGKRIEMSPRHLASASVLYASATGLLAGTELGYVGSRYLNKRNTALADGLATVGLVAGYRTSHWEVRFDARNLTDERPPVAESELGDAQYYRLPARELDVSVSTHF